MSHPHAPDQMSRHLVALSSAIRIAISDALIERGHDLSPSTAQLVPNLPLAGLGMSELSRRLRLTLQRTGQLVQRLEADGYVERVPDSSDGRAKRVVYSERGRQLVADIDEITRSVTQRFSDALGRERFERMCQDLADLDRALHGDDPPVVVAPRR